jgi:integrase
MATKGKEVRTAPVGVDVRPNSIRIQFTDAEGVRHKKTMYVGDTPMMPTAANIKRAAIQVDEIRDKIRLGVFTMAEYFKEGKSTSGILTVASQLEYWLKAQRIETSTHAAYSSAIRFWNNALIQVDPRKVDSPMVCFGEMPLKAVIPSSVLNAINTRPDLSGKTINNYRDVLNEAFQLAVDDNILSRNVVSGVPRATYQKADPDPFSGQEITAIVDAFAMHHPGQVANFAKFWFWTGLRTSEIFGLRWEHVKLVGKRPSITVKEAVVRGTKKDRTKTNVLRKVYLNSRALEALQLQQQFTRKNGEEVFQDPRYETAWIDERAFRRSYWTPLLKKIEVRYRRPYQMRHSYATSMLMSSMNHSFCARQLGHSVEVFQKTYSTWIDGPQDDIEMGLLEANLGRVDEEAE